MTTLFWDSPSLSGLLGTFEKINRNICMSNTNKSSSILLLWSSLVVLNLSRSCQLTFCFRLSLSNWINYMMSVNCRVRSIRTCTPCTLISVWLCFLDSSYLCSHNLLFNEVWIRSLMMKCALSTHRSSSGHHWWSRSGISLHWDFLWNPCAWGVCWGRQGLAVLYYHSLLHNSFVSYLLLVDIINLNTAIVGRGGLSLWLYACAAALVIHLSPCVHYSALTAPRDYHWLL